MSWKNGPSPTWSSNSAELLPGIAAARCATADATTPSGSTLPLNVKETDGAARIGGLDEVAAARNRKISTGELNRWLKEDVDLQRASNPKARPVRIYYMTQAKIAPPVFLLFTNQKKPLHFNFERFLENQLRAKWDFVGTPVRFIQRMRKRGDRSPSGEDAQKKEER